MITDERFDQLIRASLEWQADQAARRAPSLATSARRVADRLGPSASGSRPVIVARSGPGRNMQLVLLALLVLGLIAAALVVGARLMRLPSPPIEPGPLGFAATCNAQLSAGVVLEFEGSRGTTRIYEDGMVATDVSSPGASRASIVTNSSFLVRRMTQRGIELVVDRIERSGLTAGCRALRTVSATGTLTVSVATGVAQITWGPSAGSNGVGSGTPAREMRIAELAEALEDLETWLPAEGWQDAEVRQVVPDRWIVTIGLLPTDYVPGDRLELPDGYFVDGSDPRYHEVDLPGGQAPLDFGEVQPLAGRFGPGSTERCGVVEASEALALARSLDALELGADGYGDMFTEDLSVAIGFDLKPGYPASQDCQAVTAAWVAGDAPIQFSEPSGDLAGIDPCALVQPAVENLLETTGRERGGSRLPLGLDAWSCTLSRLSEGGIDVSIATLTLYPWRTTWDAAQTLAQEVLGSSPPMRRLDEHAVWANECLTSGGIECRRLGAAWSAGFFVVLEIDIFYMDPARNLTVDEVSAVMDAVLREVRG